MSCRIVLVAVILSLVSHSALALPIREFRKYAVEHQAVYASAAVSTLAYNYAAEGQVDRARCIQDWYFRGKDGSKPTGPHDLALEIEIAERQDAERLHVEGVVLGLLDRVCGNEPERSASTTGR